MNLKKYIGELLIFLVTLISNAGVASLLGVGVEDMPDSLKEKR